MPDLLPLPEFTCGVCGETFGTNCSPEDIACPECEAILCPSCQTWFGGLEGAVSAAPVHVFTRDQLVDALTRITLNPVHFACGERGVIVAEWMADAILAALDG